ncbi:unnamed protein product, partial [Tuber aestivum]
MLMPLERKRFCKLARITSKMEVFGGRKGGCGVFMMRNSSSMPIVMMEEVLSTLRASAVW